MVPNNRPYLSHLPQCNLTILFNTCFSNSSLDLCADFFSIRRLWLLYNSLRFIHRNDIEIDWKYFKRGFSFTQ